MLATDQWAVRCRPASEDCSRSAGWIEETRATPASFDMRQAPFPGATSPATTGGWGSPAATATPSDRRATSSCPTSRSCPEATRRARSRACWRPRRTQADWDAPLGWARGASRAQCAPDPVAWEGLHQRPRGRFREPTPDLRGRTGPLRLGTGSPQCPSRGRLASMAPRALDRARQPQPRSSQRSPPSAALLWTSESQRPPVLDAPVWTSGGRPTRQSAPGSCRATRSGRWRPPHRLLRPADRAAGWRRRL
jgi:hypothetical protein